jgi:hypothetical protein
MLRPLIQWARGDAAKTITSATSAAVPRRPIGKPIEDERGQAHRQTCFRFSTSRLHLLLGPVAVWPGNDLHQVAVGVFEIDAATTVQVVDLAGLGAPRIGIMLDAVSANAGERRIKTRRH